MEKIKRISSLAIISINTMMIAYFLFFISVWSSLDKNGFLPLPNLMGSFDQTYILGGISWDQLNTVPWSIGSLSLGLLTTLICALPTFMGLWFLRGIFKNYRNGNIFCTTNAKSYRMIGFLFFIDALVAIPLKGSLMTLVMTMNNPPGQRVFSISIGSTNFEALFMGLIIIVISFVMLEAGKLQSEQELVI